MKGLNSSFIVLVPKCDNPIALGDYRPITIDEGGSIGFCWGERHSIWFLIANEILDDWKRNKKRGLILKLDFEKACGNLNWNFLLRMLKSFGFLQKLVCLYLNSLIICFG